MRHTQLLGTTFAASLLFSISSQAAPVDFNFAGTGGDLNTNTLTVNGVTATSYYDNGGNWAAADLYQRNTDNDHGLGVCSPPETACQDGTGNAGGGDINELSNQLGYQEVILLDKGVNQSWVSLWVSSLDNTEVGTLFWGNSSDIDTLLGGSGNSFSYVSTDFGTSVEGNILGLSQAGVFDDMAQYLLFTPGGGGITPVSLCTTTDGGCTPPDNDYLVWKGEVNPVPVPAAVWLFGSGLIGLVGIARRKKAA
jgi:hypothetical protein